jgi:hypothetical protein
MIGKKGLLAYSERIIKTVEELPNTRTGNHVAVQWLRFGTGCLFFHSMFDVGCSMLDVHLFIRCWTFNLFIVPVRLSFTRGFFFFLQKVVVLGYILPQLITYALTRRIHMQK